MAIQLNTFTAVGTATKKVRNEKIAFASGDIPEVNMWCPHTRNPMKAIASDEYAIALYPKIGFREKTGITSEMIPIAGRIITYTTGWE